MIPIVLAAGRGGLLRGQVVFVLDHPGNRCDHPVERAFKPRFRGADVPRLVGFDLSFNAVIIVGEYGLTIVHAVLLSWV